MVIGNIIKHLALILATFILAACNATLDKEKSTGAYVIAVVKTANKRASKEKHEWRLIKKAEKTLGLLMEPFLLNEAYSEN